MHFETCASKLVCYFKLLLATNISTTLLNNEQEMSNAFKMHFEACASKLVCDFCLQHFKRHKINCIILFTFTKQLKPIRNENYIQKDQGRVKRLRLEPPHKVIQLSF